MVKTGEERDAEKEQLPAGSKGEAHRAPPEQLALSKMKDIYCTGTEGKRRGYMWLQVSLSA